MSQSRSPRLEDCDDPTVLKPPGLSVAVSVMLFSTWFGLVGYDEDFGTMVCENADPTEFEV